MTSPDTESDSHATRVETELFTAQRLAFFSDAVIAIAITLLALGLPVPQGPTNIDSLRDYGAHGDEFLAFAISFLVIGNYWTGHHRVFGNVGRVGGKLVSWNMLWLLTIVLTPFVTRVLTSDGAFPIRFGSYALVQSVAGLSFLLINREIDRCGLTRVAVPSARRRGVYRRLGIVTAAFAISIPIGFVTQWAYLCWAAIPVVSGISGRVVRRRHPPGPETGDPRT